MTLFECRVLRSTPCGARCRAIAAGLAAALLAAALLPGAARAVSPPPPVAHDVPRPPEHDPLLVPGPAPGVVATPRDPPPLPTAVRVLYAPFYVTGLVLRYGVYYLLVAPFEVLGRTLSYGAQGGVDPDQDGP